MCVSYFGVDYNWELKITASGGDRKNTEIHFSEVLSTNIITSHGNGIQVNDTRSWEPLVKSNA